MIEDGALIAVQSDRQGKTNNTIPFRSTQRQFLDGTMCRPVRLPGTHTGKEHEYGPFRIINLF